MGKQVRKQKKSSMIAGSFFRFALYLGVTIAVIYTGKEAYDFGYDIFNQEPMADEEDGRDITVVLKAEDSVYQIGKILKKKGLIEDAKVFFVQEKLSNYKGKLQPGTYILNTSMTVDDMLAILAKENKEGQPDQTDADGNAKEGSSEIEDAESQEAASEEAEQSQDEGGDTP